jgi:hypothetical protein
MKDIKATIKKNKINSVLYNKNINVTAINTKVKATIKRNIIRGVIKKYTINASLKNIPIIHKAVWGEIIGAIDNQTDLKHALNDKADANHTHSELHTHSNKAVLDKFGENAGKPTYDGEEIGGGTEFFIADNRERTTDYVYRGGTNGDGQYQINRQSVATGMHAGSAIGDWEDRTSLTYT